MVKNNDCNTEKIYSNIAFTIEFEKETSERYAEVAFDEYVNDVAYTVTSFYLTVLPGCLRYEDGYYAFDVLVLYKMPNLEFVKEYKEAIAKDYANLIELTREFAESHRGVTVKHIVNLPDLVRDDA